MEHNNIGDKKSLDLGLVLTAITNEPLQQGMQKICLDKHAYKIYLEYCLHVNNHKHDLIFSCP
jgi:hypothetical protein